jgi:hypothetical protein
MVIVQPISMLHRSQLVFWLADPCLEIQSNYIEMLILDETIRNSCDCDDVVPFEIEETNYRL